MIAAVNDDTVDAAYNIVVKSKKNLCYKRSYVICGGKKRQNLPSCQKNSYVICGIMLYPTILYAASTVLMEKK